MEDTEKQHKKHNYDWLNGYKWVKGQSGNPGGRPKGKSLKTFAREYLESIPDEEKVKYLETLPLDIVWRMAEGNPETKVDAKIHNDTFSPEEIAIAKQLLHGRTGNTGNGQGNQITQEGSGGTTS